MNLLRNIVLIIIPALCSDPRRVGLGARSGPRPRSWFSSGSRYVIPSGSSSAELYSCSRDSWMSCFADSSLLTIPIIPGTHHSGVKCSGSLQAQPIFAWAKCQSIGIEEQLLAGVRFLDLRIHVDGERVTLSHRMESDTTLDDAMFVITQFLNTHPTETVILYIRLDPDYDWGDAEKTTLTNTLAKYSERTFAASNTNDNNELSQILLNLKVNELAGKMLFVSRETHIDRTKVNFFPDIILQYCDTWECFYVSDVKARVHNHMTINTLESESGDTPTSPRFLGGIALDGPFPLRPKNWTSLELNQWIIDNVASNPEWHNKIHNDEGFGVVMIDFADDDIIRFLIDTNMKIRQERDLGSYAAKEDK